MYKYTLLLALSASAFGAGQTPARARQVLADNWYVKQLEPGNADVSKLSFDKTWLTAKMPAQVHEVLLQHGLIADPRLSENAAKVTWVADKDWAYACKFSGPANPTGPVYLEFDGLDTLATAYLNGIEIGRFDDMYRQYRIDVRKQIGKDNLLLIVFRSPNRFMEQFQQPAAQVDRIPKTRYLRKANPDFSNYLGAQPNFVKVGVFRDVVLDVPGSAWIEDVWVRSELSSDFRRATLRARVETAGTAREVAWRLTDPSGAELSHGKASSGTDVAIAIPEPKLWWPRGHGPQNLYKFTATVAGGIDSREVSVGIRDVKPVLKDPVTGENRFRFDVNGKPIYFQGALWSQIDQFSHCWRPEIAKRLLDMAEHTRMNIFRVWGEGNEPSKEFYDECDRRGIMIWQDFWFSGGEQPTDMPGFMENARAETEEMVRRLRNHPSLLLWCGGNENFMFVIDWYRRKFTFGGELFLKVFPEIVARLDPARYYHPNSPYGGPPSPYGDPLANWPLEGDYHDYTTIHFEPETAVPLWSSEILRTNPPSLNSMRKFMTEEEIWPKGWSTAIHTPGQPAWPPAWQYHSTGTATWDRIGPIERYIDPVGPAEFIRNLQTAYGDYIQERVERQRRGVPDGAPDGSRRNWGNTIVRMYDPWPMIYSSIIDYYLEPNMAYYYLRRAYDPILVSFEHTPDSIAVWVTNDSPESVSGKLAVTHLKLDGKVMGEMSADVTLGAAESKRVLNLDKLGFLSLREEFLRATFDGRDATLLLNPERYVHLPHPKLQVRRVGDSIEVRTDVFARQVTFEAEGALFEDNYFDMAPGQTRTVKILSTPAGAITVRAINVEAFRLPSD